jgi:4-hydroxybenzoate polyprenyltransferase
MNLNTTFFSTFISLGFTLAFSALGICLATLILLGWEISFALLFVVFSVELITYHINHKAELKNDYLTNPERVENLKKTKFFDYLITTLFILAIILTVIESNTLSLIIILLPVFTMAFYTFNLIPEIISKEIGFLRLKQVILLKNIVVSLCWALIPVLTAVFLENPVDEKIIIIAGLVFIRLMVNTIAFDVKDIISDRKNNVQTIPLKLGIKKTQKLLHIINTLTIFYIAFFIIINKLPPAFLLLTFVFFYGFYYINQLNNKQINQQTLYEGIIDLECATWPVLLIIGIYFF